MPKVKRSIPSQDELLKVLKVLDLVVPSINLKRKRSLSKSEKDVYSYAASEANQHQNVKTMGKKCVELVNQSLYSQRYEEAIKLLSILCQDNTVYGNFIFKATMACLENLQFSGKEEVIHRFISNVHNLPLIYAKETSLEYIMCGLRNNFLDLYGKLKAWNFARKKQKHEVIDSLFKAYFIYVDYATQYCNDNGELQAFKAPEVSMVIENFKELICNPGDWDVFILKLVEVLEVSGKHEEIVEVLSNYAERNPNHINAHIYLCDHLNKYDPDSERLIHHLKIVAELYPGDERVLLLIEKWKKCEREFQNCLHLLFMFLDYPFNGQNIKAWEMLSNFLLPVQSRKEKKKIKRLHWVSRCHSWYWVHFNSSQICHLSEKDVSLVAVKTAVLLYFDKEHAYIKEMQKKFPEISSS